MKTTYEIISGDEFSEIYPLWDIKKELGAGVFYQTFIPIIEILKQGKKEIHYPLKEEMMYEASYSYKGADFRPIIMNLKEFGNFSKCSDNNDFKNTAFYKRIEEINQY